MDRETELALIGRLRDGDIAAFDAAYDEFSGRLSSFLARLSGRREVADDLLEETWLRLVTNAKRLRPDTRLGPWLFTIARNLHVSYRRSRLRGHDMRTDDNREDRILLALAGLPVREPDRRRSERIRKRCHAALGRPSWAERGAAIAGVPFNLALLESMLVAGVSGGYLVEVLRRALRLYAL